MDTILEAIKNLLDFVSFAANVVIWVLGTHESEIARFTGLHCVLASFPDDSSTNQHFNLGPVGSRVELQKVNDILTKKMLRAEITESLILVEEEFKNHAKEQIRANIAMIGFRVASNFEHTLQHHEYVLELRHSSNHSLNL